MSSSGIQSFGILGLEWYAYHAPLDRPGTDSRLSSPSQAIVAVSPNFSRAIVGLGYSVVESAYTFGKDLEACAVRISTARSTRRGTQGGFSGGPRKYANSTEAWALLEKPPSRHTYIGILSGILLQEGTLWRRFNWRVTVGTWSRCNSASMTAAYIPFALFQVVACESAISAMWGSRVPRGVRALECLSAVTLGLIYYLIQGKWCKISCASLLVKISVLPLKSYIEVSIENLSIT